MLAGDAHVGKLSKAMLDGGGGACAGRRGSGGA
jgi:hypothetical protein